MGFKYAQPAPTVAYPKKETLPAEVIDGTKTDIDASAAPLAASNTTITKGILLRIDSLGGSAFVKIGNVTSQHLIFSLINTYVWIDWADSLSKIYVVGDGVGADAEVSWNGG